MNYAHNGRRVSGLVAALSALRSRESPACGEYPDLAALGGLARAWGLDLIQLLPVNDSGSQSSPYSALSAFALHPLYLRVADLPEAAGKAGAPYRKAAAELAARFADDARLRYGPYLEAKLALLERIYAERGAAALGLPGAAPGAGARVPAGAEAGAASEAGAFRAFVAANPWVKAYAVFSELKRRYEGKPWWEWTERRDPEPAEVEALWEEPSLAAGTRFRAWLQWRAEGQFAAAAAALREAGVELMGDIPILISEDSAEVWARRRVFRLGLAAGAPPDMYSHLGQNWGFPIYDWEALEREGYGFWKERLASCEKFYSAYRIDHVLGFFRIWALSGRDRTGYLGRFVPDAHIGRAELEALGFGPDRLRWLSEPHVRTERLVAACSAGGAGDADAMEAALLALDRIGNEELFLFKRSIRGEKDIEELAARGAAGYGGAGVSEGARAFLLEAWRRKARAPSSSRPGGTASSTSSSRGATPPPGGTPRRAPGAASPAASGRPWRASSPPSGRRASGSGRRRAAASWASSRRRAGCCPAPRTWAPCRPACPASSRSSASWASASSAGRGTGAGPATPSLPLATTPSSPWPAPRSTTPPPCASGGRRRPTAAWSGTWPAGPSARTWARRPRGWTPRRRPSSSRRWPPRRRASSSIPSRTSWPWERPSGRPIPRRSASTCRAPRTSGTGAGASQPPWRRSRPTAASRPP